MNTRNYPTAPSYKSYFIKIVIVFILSFAMLLPTVPASLEIFGKVVGTTEAYAATNGWVASGGNWYYYINGVTFKGGWKEIYHSGRWDYYYFRSDGKMATGWLSYDGGWFYLADGYGQNIGFNSSEYGTMRRGWQWINHSTGRWDEYYFRGGNSGRMVTGWLKVDGHTFFLANGEVGQSFNSTDYGVCLKGLHKIGVYTYYFRKGSDEWGFDRFPIGGMAYSINYVEFFGPNGVMVMGKVDQYGRVTIYGLKSAPVNPEAEIYLEEDELLVLDPDAYDEAEIYPEEDELLVQDPEAYAESEKDVSDSDDKVFGDKESPNEDAEVPDNGVSSNSEEALMEEVQSL